MSKYVILLVHRNSFTNMYGTYLLDRECFITKTTTTAATIRKTKDVTKKHKRGVFLNLGLGIITSHFPEVLLFFSFSAN